MIEFAARLALAAVAGLGLNLAVFEAFTRLPVAVAVAAFGCYPLFVAAWEATRGRSAAGMTGPGLAMAVIIGLVLLMRRIRRSRFPRPACSWPCWLPSRKPATFCSVAAAGRGRRQHS